MDKQKVVDLEEQELQEEIRVLKRILEQKQGALLDKGGKCGVVEKLRQLYLLVNSYLREASNGHRLHYLRHYHSEGERAALEEEIENTLFEIATIELSFYAGVKFSDRYYHSARCHEVDTFCRGFEKGVVFVENQMELVRNNSGKKDLQHDAGPVKK